MRRLLAMTNTLLAVIAVCLLLIVARLYDVALVAPAQAAPPAPERTWSSSDPLPVQVVNDRLACTVEGTVDARMHLNDIGWSPATGKHGVLSVQVQE